MSCSAVISGIEGASRMSAVLGLKVRPSTATVLPRSTPAKAEETLRAIARFLISLTVSTASRMRSGTSWSCAVLISARTSFGKQEPPKASPGMKKLRADAVVEADAARDLLHIGADALAEVGDLVDEGDLGGEERIGGIFDELRGAAAGVEDRRLVEVERAVDLGRDLHGAFVIGADDDAVGMLEIVNGGTFA